MLANPRPLFAGRLRESLRAGSPVRRPLLAVGSEVFLPRLNPTRRLCPEFEEKSLPAAQTLATSSEFDGRTA